MAKILTIPCGMVNCFILSGENGAVLVDTGLKPFRGRVLQKAEEHRVKCILLTHGHTDHIENAAYLAKEWKVPVLMSRKDVPLAGDNRAYPMASVGLKGGILNFFTKISSSGAAADAFETESLEDGNSLEGWGIDDAVVVALPGHTGGSVGILFDKGTQLIAGDAVMNFFSPSFAPIAENPELAKKTAHSLKGGAIKTIYPGHGKPFSPEKLP